MSSDIQHITEAITDFVKGGDERNTAKLERVLHKDFRVMSSGFMGNPGVAIIDRDGYLEKIRENVFGGIPREMSVEHIDHEGNIALVKLKLRSDANSFVSYNSLVRGEIGQWQLIANLALVEAL